MWWNRYLKSFFVEDKVLLSLHNYTKAADDYARFTPNSRGTWDWLPSAKLVVNRELVGKVVCSSYVTHQKIISCSWILALAITRAYSPLKSTSSTTAFNLQKQSWDSQFHLPVTQLAAGSSFGRKLVAIRSMASYVIRHGRKQVASHSRIFYLMQNFAESHR